MSAFSLPRLIIPVLVAGCVPRLENDRLGADICHDSQYESALQYKGHGITSS